MATKSKKLRNLQNMGSFEDREDLENKLTKVKEGAEDILSQYQDSKDNMEDGNTDAVDTIIQSVEQWIEKLDEAIESIPSEDAYLEAAREEAPEAEEGVLEDLYREELERIAEVVDELELDY